MSTKAGLALPSITVELTQADVGVILVALADAKRDDGANAWNHPNVARLRLKLADAIRDGRAGRRA
jgi:hypothetical protein